MNGKETDLASGTRSGGANVLLLRHTGSAACTGGDGLGLSSLEVENVTAVLSHGRILDRDSRGQGDEGEDNSGKSELHFERRCCIVVLCSKNVGKRMIIRPAAGVPDTKMDYCGCEGMRTGWSTSSWLWRRQTRILYCLPFAQDAQHHAPHHRVRYQYLPPYFRVVSDPIHRSETYRQNANCLVRRKNQALMLETEGNVGLNDLGCSVASAAKAVCHCHSSGGLSAIAMRCDGGEGGFTRSMN